MKIKELYVEVPQRVGSTLRRATDEEKTAAWARKSKIDELTKAIDVLKDERMALRNACNHKVIHDEPGFEYNIRFCAGCGASMGLV